MQPPEALRLLENRAWVRALARRLLADENDVDDVEQETWAAALRSGPDEPRALRAWLGVVASRFALQRLRRRTRRARLEESVAGPERVERSPADVLAEADAHGHVVAAVLALEEPYRTTVLLRYFEGLAIADVARKMDVPLETVRTRLRRAHERLRESLEDENKRALALLLAPLGATATPRAAPSSAATTRVPFVRAAALTAAGVGILSFVAWTWTRDAVESDVAKSDADARIVTAADRDARPAAKPADPVAAPTRDRRDEKQPSPSETSTASSPPPAAPGAGDAWIAYDLADGKPLAAFALRVTTSAGETTVTTDDAGRIPVDRATVLDVASVESTTWTFARPTKGAVKDEASLWFWREREVTGTVRSADPATPLSPGGVQFAWQLPLFSVQPSTPGNPVHWLREHGFDANADQRPTNVRADETGRVVGKAIAMRGAMLAAQADGFGPDAAPLVWNREGDCTVTIEFRPTIRVVGRVLDTSGAPVVGERVTLDSLTEAATQEESARTLSALIGGRKSCIAGYWRGSWHVTSMESATTDVRGIFEFRTAATGTKVVALFKPGCLVCRQELGPLTKDVAPFEMRLAPSNVRVQFLDAGTPIASNFVSLQVADGHENGFSLSLDAEGRADAGWLQRGRWYHASYGSKSGCFVWDGQATIDLAQLPKEPPQGK